MILPFRKNKITLDAEKAQLASQYAELLERLEQIRTNFNHVTDSAAIDALIYEENAVLTRLGALYRTARAAGLEFDIYENKK